VEFRAIVPGFPARMDKYRQIWNEVGVIPDTSNM
jgi:hypothetical protein